MNDADGCVTHFPPAISRQKSLKKCKIFFGTKHFVLHFTRGLNQAYMRLFFACLSNPFFNVKTYYPKAMNKKKNFISFNDDLMACDFLSTKSASRRIISVINCYS